MPCNIGFKSYAKIEIPVPQPQAFTAKSEAPEISADLLEKLGVEDPEFLSWAKELEIKPLLETALERTLRKISRGDIDFTIDDRGMLEAKGRFITAREKKLLSEKVTAVADQWQFEILGIVAELLNYRPTITTRGKELTLVAEEEGKSHPCNYIKVTRQEGISTLTFEHFKSRGSLELETAKFLTLAHQLRVKIALGKNEISEGDPLPSEQTLITEHRHGHGHRH